jgi:hypothetical protein
VGLRRETVNEMKAAGFLKSEISDLNNARTPSGEKQDLELIVQSKTFAHLLDSRREWWENALKPKTLGGKGLTYKEAKKSLENFYEMKGKRKTHLRNFWSWLKISYRPKEKLQTKSQFKTAITAKSLIGKTIGKYGEKLKARYSPTKRCSHCSGTGTLRNLYGQNQTCIYCSGTGVEKQRFI